MGAATCLVGVGTTPLPLKQGHLAAQPECGFYWAKWSPGHVKMAWRSGLDCWTGSCIESVSQNHELPVSSPLTQMERACISASHCFYSFCSGVPTGIRTPVTAVKELYQAPYWTYLNNNN
jgi:hypothetical protein